MCKAAAELISTVDDSNQDQRNEVHHRRARSRTAALADGAIQIICSCIWYV
jgi:hypothetical protein